MEIITFLYNIFLIILYSVGITFAVLAYLQRKEKVILLTAILLLFYIFDNIIIYMTEFLDSFSMNYDLQFMSVPAFKTVILVVDCFCLCEILQELLPERKKRLDIPFCVLLTLCLLFIPMLKNGAFKVWLYYLPHQFFILYLSYSGLRYLKSITDVIEVSHFVKNLRFIMRICFILSILIMIEDTVVIFSFDVYSDFLVKINNRSLTEDILSMILCVFAIKELSDSMWWGERKEDKDAGVNRVLSGGMEETSGYDGDHKEVYGVDLERSSEGECGTSEHGVSGEPELRNHKEESENRINVCNISGLDPIFYHFSLKFQLTGREQDILRILLKDKNNQEISDELFISVGTVKTHVHNIFQKTEVTKRSQLLRLYHEYGHS